MPSIDMVEFPSSSAAASAAFMQEVFGWTPTTYGADYVDVQGGGVALGFQSDVAEQPAGPLVVIRVDDLEVARAAIEAAGGAVTVEPFDFPGGRPVPFPGARCRATVE
jgi:hypothetical protein